MIDKTDQAQVKELAKRLIREKIEGTPLRPYVVGIGATPDGEGGYAIMVYLYENPENSFPQEFDGVKIVVTVTGEINAADLVTDVTDEDWGY